MKRNEIDKIFTAMLAEKLSEGYTIDTENLYKETVALEKDGHYFGLLINNFSEWGEERFEGIEICFGENPEYKPGWTFWNSKVEKSFSRKFYKVNSSFKSDWFVETKEEAEAAGKLRYERHENRGGDELGKGVRGLPSNVVSRLVMAKVRKERGFKKSGINIVRADNVRDIRNGKVTRNLYRIIVKKDGEQSNKEFTYSLFA